MRKAAIAVCLAACLALAGCGTSATTRSDEPQTSEGRFVSNGPTCFVVTDAETGVQYLFAKHGYGGGFTVLLNADGTPCTVEEEGCL